jgi:hypothetical protein
MFSTKYLDAIIACLIQLKQGDLNDDVLTSRFEAAAFQKLEQQRAIQATTGSQNLLDDANKLIEFKFNELNNFFDTPKRAQIAEKIGQIYRDYLDSVLMGEYYINNCLAKLHDINSLILELIKNIDQFAAMCGKNVTQVHFTNFKKELHSFQRDYNLDYIYLADKVDHRLRKSSRLTKNVFLEDKLRFMSDRLESTVINPSERPSLKYFLFLLNVKLAEMDEGHLCSEESLNQLLEYTAKLFTLKKGSLIPENHYVEIAKEKCDFFIMKILRRLRLSNESELSYTIHTSGDLLNYGILDPANNFIYYLYCPG